MRHRFLSRAVADVVEARNWYGLEDPDRGVRFEHAVEQTMHRIRRFPHAGIHTARGYRWRRVPGFPYRVVYRVSRNELLVVAVPHDSQDTRGLR